MSILHAAEGFIANYVAYFIFVAHGDMFPSAVARVFAAKTNRSLCAIIVFKILLT